MAGRPKGSSPPAEAALASTSGSAEPAELVPPPVADDVIDEVYDAVRGLARDASVRFHVDIGKVIFDRFYGSDERAFRHRGAKDASLRKLADRFEKDKDAPDGTSASALYRAVAIYELDQRLGVSARKHLTLTHIRAVLGLPDREQERLLKLAEEKAWTTRQLEDKAAAARKKEGDRRGRPVLPMFVKTIHKLGRMVDGDEDLFADLDQVDTLDEEEATKLYQAVTGMKLKCEDLQKKLVGRTKGHRSKA